MSTGATDGSRLRNAEIPVYGVSGIFLEFGETAPTAATSASR
jgi:hypothetical protein